MHFIKGFLIMIFFAWCTAATAQETQFTQKYANRLSLNPAFAGLNHNWSVTFTHRNQWPTLNGSFITNQLAADYSLPDRKSAIGLILQQDRAGIGGLQKLEAAAGYAYHARLSSKFSFSGGLQLTVASLRVSLDNLVFGDQLSDNGLVALTSAEANNFEPFTYASVTAGGLVFTDQLWVGLAVAHLNRPTYGFHETNRMPIRFTANAGYKFYIDSYETNNRLMEFSISPSVTYTQQEDFMRTDAGVYTIYTPLTLGLIYRGVPFTGGAEQDRALAVLAGLQLKQFEIGFSHDIGLAGMSELSGGANEITLTIKDIPLNRSNRGSSKNKFSKSIFCPAF